MTATRRHLHQDISAALSSSGKNNAPAASYASSTWQVEAHQRAFV
jgi:hypothetical protein